MRSLKPTLLLLALLAGIAVPAAVAQARPSQFTIFEAPRELISDDDALRTQTFDEIDHLGARWIRVVLYWHDVAPSPDAGAAPAFDETDPTAYAFGRYDRLMNEAKAHGLRVLMTISGPVPRWATEFRRDTVSRPLPGRFQKFATAVGRRYGSRVDLWAVWNEPNHPDFLAPQYTGQGRRKRPVSPGIYRRLFFAASRGLKASGARARVLAGETAPVGTGKVVAPITFLRGTMCLDGHFRKRRGCPKLPAYGWAHHAYTPKSGPRYVSASRNNVTIGTLGRLTSALTRAGRAGGIRRGAPVYLTEFGIQSKPDPYYGVGQARQNEYRARSEQIAYRNRRVYAFSQYLMRDDPPVKGPRSQRYSGFESGLRTAAGRKKLAYAGFPLPLVADRTARSTRLWGLVRPATGRTRVTIDYRDRHARRWRRLKTRATNARGVWSTTTRNRSGRRYRVRWASPAGAKYTSPGVHGYRW